MFTAFMTCIILYCIVLYYIALCFILYCAVLYHVVLYVYCATLKCTNRITSVLCNLLLACVLHCAIFDQLNKHTSSIQILLLYVGLCTARILFILLIYSSVFLYHIQSVLLTHTVRIIVNNMVICI